MSRLKRRTIFHTAEMLANAPIGQLTNRLEQHGNFGKLGAYC